jgi:hypothetical protein
VPSLKTIGVSMRRSLTLVDRLKAEELRERIRELETEQRSIAARFASYHRSSVEEQLATQLAFKENRRALGRLSQELLRLVCI